MSIQIPSRADGMPDLNNWQEYIKQFNYENLGEIISVRDMCSKGATQEILLSKAISYKKSKIADSFANTLCREGLTINQAISILELAKNKIMESKFTHP